MRQVGSWRRSRGALHHWFRLLVARKTRVTEPDCRRRRLHHRQQVRGRVSGRRPVLRARLRRSTATPAALGHGNLHAQNPCAQASLIGTEDRSLLQGQDRDTVRAAGMFRSQHRSRQQEPAGRSSAKSRCGGTRPRSLRPSTSPAPLSPQEADPTATQRETHFIEEPSTDNSSSRVMASGRYGP